MKVSALHATKSKKHSMQSINQHYTADHERLDELFHQFQKQKTTNRDPAIKAFQEFKAGLERHIIWEEEILFPSFEKKFGHLGGPTVVMRWEHQEIRKYLDAISAKLAQEDLQTEAEEVGLTSVLCSHNHKEESILYPMIDQTTYAEERKEIFARMGKEN